MEYRIIRLQWHSKGYGGGKGRVVHPFENFQMKNYILPDALVVEVGASRHGTPPLPFLHDAQHCPTLKAAPKFLRSIFIEGIVHILYWSDGCYMD